MDIFTLVVIIAMVLLIMIVVATLYSQQSGQLRDIQTRLEKLGEGGPVRREPETLRMQRAEWLDPLSRLEVELHAQRRDALTDDELQTISEAREGVKAITAELKNGDAWLGAPYDLEWTEYLDRLPVVKSLYMRASLAGGAAAALPAPRLISGN